MEFGRLSLDRAEGAVLAHTLRLADGVFKKGRILSAEDVGRLRRDGRERVMAARLEEGDVAEDAAAARLGRALAGEGVEVSDPFTGRCNLRARAHGLAVLDPERLEEMNRVHEGVTVATLAPHAVVHPRTLVATVKIIPFAVPDAVVSACEDALRGPEPAIRALPFRSRDAGLVVTRLPGTPEKLLEASEETMRARLEGLGGGLGAVVRCEHAEEAVAGALERLLDRGLWPVLVLGASAIVDREDVVPGAVRRIGGRVEHFGLPVDPGNLLLLAYRHGTPVVGVPGCARSPKPSGFDLVLRRLLAGLPLDSGALMAMGVGGLLKEIPSRPRPRGGSRTADEGREGGPEARSPRIAGLVLAAGRSRRMGEVNKLLAEVDGVPMVARVVDTLRSAGVDPVVVVTGHEAERVEAVLEGRRVTTVRNPEHARGLSTSLRAGIRALEEEGASPADDGHAAHAGDDAGPAPSEPAPAEAVDGALVCLADMPWVGEAAIRALVDRFDPAEGRAICVPVHDRKRGNPVLWAARYFPEMKAITGDVGAKELLARHPEAVCRVAVEAPGVLLDVDTPEALDAARRDDDGA